MNLQIIAIILASALGTAVLALVIGSFYMSKKGDQTAKPLRLNVLLLCYGVLGFMLVLVLLMFALLWRFDVSDSIFTEALIGSLAALVFIAIGAGIALFSGAVSAVTTDPEPSPPDHLGEAIKALAENQRLMIDMLKHAPVESDPDPA